jgi:hypothetical protein
MHQSSKGKKGKVSPRQLLSTLLSVNTEKHNSTADSKEDELITTAELIHAFSRLGVELSKQDAENMLCFASWGMVDAHGKPTVKKSSMLDTISAPITSYRVVQRYLQVIIYKKLSSLKDHLHII